jgi:hypothetical protein
MRIFLFISVFIASVQYGRAQFTPGSGSDKIEVSPNTAPKRTILKVSLLTPIETQNSINVAVEVSLNEHLSLQPEIGYIFDYHSGTSRDKIASNYINTQQKLSLRYYVPEKVVNGLYVGPQLSYTNFNFKRGIWRNLDPHLSEKNYFLDYSNPGEYQQMDYGIYATAGVQPVLSRHFTLDLKGGAGMVVEQLNTKYDPGLSGSAPLPPPFFRYKFDGLFSIHFGYVF